MYEVCIDLLTIGFMLWLRFDAKEGETIDDYAKIVGINEEVVQLILENITITQSSSHA